MPWSHKLIDSSQISLDKSDNFNKVFEESNSQDLLTQPYADVKEAKVENTK